MRLFFIMLVLLNGVFLAINMLHEPETDQKIAVSNSNIPQLVLLNENITAQQVDRKEVSDTKKQEEPSLGLKTWLTKFTAENASIDQFEAKIQQPLLNKEIQTFCYTSGPFQSKDTLQQAVDYFTRSDIQSQQRSIEENHYIGMLVYLPSQSSRKESLLIAKKLAAKGVTDYMLLNEPGKRHSLSLGVYGLKKNAEQRIKTLTKLNYKPLSEARYRKNTVYWLDYAFSSSNNLSESSAEHMSRLKVSQIERNCKS